MAASKQPLIWNYYRPVAAATGLGAVVHYFDEESQSLYLNGGLETIVADVPEGHWSSSDPQPEIKINTDTWTHLRFDHPSNGVLYGVASTGSKWEFIRYRYAYKVSDILDSWSLTLKSDTPVAQFNGAVMNIDSNLFGSEASLFQPGAKLPVSLSMGDSTSVLLGTVYLDEAKYNILDETMSISARSICGSKLKDQTFDEDITMDKAITEIINDILDRAGVTARNVQTIETTDAFEFKASNTFLDALQTVLNKHSTADHAYSIIELPDGTVCIGRDDWLNTYAPKSRYEFDEGKDVFTRETSRAVDAAYTHIRVTGRGLDNNDLTPVYLPVNTYQYWSIGAHKTKHISVSEPMTQESLQAYAVSLANKLQYVGIGESFSSPFRPQLIIGDVAAVKQGEDSYGLGLINEYTHEFSKDGGYKTSFRVDSGGDMTDRSYNIYTHAASLNGYNRKQTIMDIVRMTVENDSTKLAESDFSEVTPQMVHDLWESL